MSSDITAGNVGKVNGLIQRHAQLNVTDGSQANYVSNFKKADADGNGQISRDEFKRFAKDALPKGVDLSMFGGGDVQMAAFDQALDDWFTSVSGTDAASGAAVISEKRSALPPLDPGKTWTRLGAEKVARGEDLNFGHQKVDGQLWKLQDGSPVWADTGTQVTREQLAAMPDTQVKKFYQMMGLGYDPKVDFPDPIERERLADRVRIPDPGTSPEADEALKNLRADLDQIHASLSQRETLLKSQLTGADASTTQQIQAQLAQIGGFKGQVESMRDEVKAYRIPTGLSSEAEGRVTDALKQMHGDVKRMAGTAASDRGPLVASFVRSMTQLRDPQRDIQADPLAQSHYDAMIDVSRVTGALSDKMDQLLRQRPGSTSETAAQIDAQLAQLQNVYQGFSSIAAPLFTYRPDPALSAEDRKAKEASIREVHDQIKRMAGMDATEFQRMLDQAKKKLSGL